MQYKVYHAVRPTFMEGDQWFPSDYVLVATVEATSVDDVFRLTNHIESDWRKNPGVEATADARRSTSVGDVVVDNDGKVWECAGCGWKERK